MEKTKLPAQKLSRAEMLKQIREHNARVPEMVRKGFGAHAVGVLDHFYAMNEDEVFVWRIRLDCGCTSLASTVGNDAALLERVAQWCPRHYMNYRTVTEWADRRLVSETGLLWDDMPEMHKIHRGKERARWTVTLECGHSQDVETDVEFDPATGPRYLTEERRRELEDDNFLAVVLDGETNTLRRDHEQRMWDLGLPEPRPEVTCRTCMDAKHTVVAYWPDGWLKRRTVPKKKAAPVQPDRTALERRLKNIEAEAEALREALK